MNTSKTLFIAGLLIATSTVLVGCGHTPTDSQANTPTPSEIAQSIFSPVYASEQYATYSTDAVDKAQAEGKDVAVFFHSKSCGSCAKLDGDFKANESDLPDDLVVFKADWDDNQALAQDLNVAKYHTVAYYQEDGTTDNVKGLFTVEEVADAARPDTEVISNAGEYKAYSTQALAMAEAEGKDVAVFFHSKSCGSCAKLDADINANLQDIPSDVAILKADRDKNQTLATQYDVAKYHTVTFLDGNKGSNVKGLFTLEELLAAK